jgi:hypothetical protein
MRNHPRYGEPTFFETYIFNGKKKHTIRAGNRIKQGEMVSLRTWTGVPYKSKQREFKQVVAEKIFRIDIYETMEIYIDGKFFCNYGSELICDLARNDGLEEIDFKCWFTLPFSGQIICWDEKVNY